MNIGLALLYAAFAVVALWLLGEVLLQHRAPAHWRLLALLGFLGLVAGVYRASPEIVVGGVLVFGAGQGLVTRSVKRGSGPHWSLRGADGALPGPLGVLGRVFPAAEVPESAAAADPARRVGAVGPVEDSAEPVQAESAVEFVESQPYDGDEPEEPGYAGAAYGAQPPQQYEQGYQPGYQQEYAYPYQQQAAGYGDWQYQQGEYAQQQYPQQQYAEQQAYAEQQYPQQQYAEQYQQQYPQPGYAQQQPGAEDYDAVGYDPQGTYQYDYQQQGQYQPQPQPGYGEPGAGAQPEGWTYG